MIEIIFPLIIVVALIALAIIMYNISKESYKKLAADLEEEQAKVVEEKTIPVETKVEPVVEPQVEVKQETITQPASAPKPSKKPNRKKKSTN
jgi:outer membrane biosynthesis protein TonB